jgi:parallel beta-helix repeat protein
MRKQQIDKKYSVSLVLSFLVIIVLLATSGCKKSAPTERGPQVKKENNTQEKDVLSIQGRINKAKSGDTIHLDGGIYAESLNIRKDLKLIGKSKEDVIFRPVKTESRCVIYVYDGAEVFVEGITINCKPEESQEAIEDGITVNKGTVHLSNCEMRGARHNGLYLIESEATVINSIFESNGNCGIHVRRGTITVKDCVFRRNVDAGIFCHEEDLEANIDKINRYEITGSFFENNKQGVNIKGLYAGKVSQCKIRDNESLGILIDSLSGQNDIVDNVIGQTENGIWYKTEGKEREEKGIIQNNFCRQTNTGISIKGDKTIADIIENNCSGNDEYGIAVGDKAQVRVLKNTCNENTKQGIYLHSQSENILAEENECCSNKLNGIYIAGGTVKAVKNICKNNIYNGISVYRGEIYLEQNECSDNKGSGIYLLRHTDGHVKNNICANNRFYGIIQSEYTAVPEVEGNEIANNIKGGIWCEKREYGDVRTLLKGKKFDELEEIASRLRSEETKDKDGKWIIRFFYADLSDDWTEVSEAYHDRVVGILQEWINEKPESITPYVVLSGVYVSNAWSKRGSDWAYEVTEEGWEGFRESLNNALAVIRKGEELEQKDAHLYHNLIMVGLGLSNRGLESEGFEKGVGVNKYYPVLYIQRGITLLPRWGGGEGEYEAFADKALEMTKDQEGAILYARLALAAHSYTYPDFDKFKFSYEKIKQGHEDILERYPDSNHYLNSYCLFACLNNDLEKAKELFEKIDGNITYVVWKNESYLGQHYDWVFSGNAPK